MAKRAHKKEQIELEAIERQHKKALTLLQSHVNGRSEFFSFTNSSDNTSQKDK